eukprot:278335-Chlamydomonas_euryale.AAC.7
MAAVELQVLPGAQVQSSCVQDPSNEHQCNISISFACHMLALPPGCCLHAPAPMFLASKFIMSVFYVWGHHFGQGHSSIAVIYGGTNYSHPCMRAGDNLHAAGGSQGMLPRNRVSQSELHHAVAPTVHLP